MERVARPSEAIEDYAKAIYALEQRTGGPVTMCATLVPGDPYYLSETAVVIQPAADLGTGENVCQLGLAVSASVLNVAIQVPGVTK